MRGSLTWVIGLMLRPRSVGALSKTVLTLRFLSVHALWLSAIRHRPRRYRSQHENHRGRATRIADRLLRRACRLLAKSLRNSCVRPTAAARVKPQLTAAKAAPSNRAERDAAISANVQRSHC